MIWANTPDRHDALPADIDRLPWMRPTRVSDKGLATYPVDEVSEVEAFFGMPRRLRLVEEDGVITGVIQRPWGTNYASWEHPLTPYYLAKSKTGEKEWLPVHPRAGRFGYRHWLGILAEEVREGDKEATSELARVLRLWRQDGRGASDESVVLVAGWAMDNMKPRDFAYSVQPFVLLDEDAEAMLAGLVMAAEQASLAMRAAFGAVLGEGEARESEREAFYAETERAFLDRLGELKTGAPPQEVAAHWLKALREAAIRRFEARALKGLDQRKAEEIERIKKDRGFLIAAFDGYGKYGGALFEALRMERPAKGKKQEKAA